MTRHPRHVEGFEGPLEELAKNIGNMTYDRVEEFIGELADDIKRQADADSARGRKNLARELYATAEILYWAKTNMGLVWKICEPYMK